MIWTFTKMHGTGNDFIVLDGVRQPIELTPERARALADRHFGVGADQILLVEAPLHPEADFRYRIFNADGGEVEHCGNGARCFMRFVHDQGLSRRNPLRAEISTGLITLTADDSGEVTVDMGVTRFEPEDVGFNAEGLASRRNGEDTIWTLPLSERSLRSEQGSQSMQHAALRQHTAADQDVEISLVAISNPHAVQVVEHVDTAPVPFTGPQISTHPRFAHGVNAGYMQVLDSHTIKLRVFERGAGETLACGTGACAAVVVGIRRGLLVSPVLVHTRGGPLTISWDGKSLQMRGPAVSVFTGQIDVESLANAKHA